MRVQAPELKPHDRVFRRPESTVWQFYVTTPPHLSHHFDGKPFAYRKSLGTRDLAEANRRAKLIDAEWVQRFRQLEAQDNPEWATLTPELVSAIAAGVRRWVLEADDNMRSFPEGPNGLLARDERRRLLALAHEALEPGLDLKAQPDTLRLANAGRLEATAEAPAPDPLAGLSAAQHGAMARFNAEAEAGAAIDTARRNLKSTQPLADAVAREMGLSVEWSSGAGPAALLECLKAYRVAMADLLRRDSGDVIDTPAPRRPVEPAQEPAATRKTHSPMDAFDAWEKAKPGRPRKTVDTYRAAAEKLAEMLGGRSLEAMTRDDGRAIESALRIAAIAKKGTAMNTAANHLSKFKTLLAQAVDLEWRPENPLVGRSIEKVKRTRKPWRIPELIALFDDPLFTGYRIPSGAMAGKDAAYWLPLLGLFTGARISELAQLHTRDLEHTESAGWVLSIKEDEGEGQRVKNAHSIRQVPVHPELERLGLIDYLKAIREHGAGPLWPAVVRSKLNGAGGKVSQWFGIYKTGKGFGRDHVFHSFRHSLETQLRAMSIPKYQIDALAGHSGGSVSDDYAHPTPETLRPILERLQFPGLNLPRVFTAPVWSPAD